MAGIQYKLIDKLNTLLFNNTTNSAGGEKVRDRILKFNNQILQVNPLAGRNDEDIVKLLRKLEGAAAPLGDSSENNQLLERLLYEDFHKAGSREYKTVICFYMNVLETAISSPTYLPMASGFFKLYEKIESARACMLCDVQL